MVLNCACGSKKRLAPWLSHWTKAARTYVNMFEGPVTGNIPEVLDNGEVTDGTHVTAGQLALALTPYAQVTDLAVNTAASGNNAAAIQSLDDRVTAELASKLDSSALAPASAPLATAAALATTDGQVAAHGSSIAALQSSLTTGLSNKADQSAFDVLEGVVATKSTPDGVDLKLSNYSTTAAMNGSIASANNATLAGASRDASISGLQASEVGGGLKDSSGPPKRGHHGGPAGKADATSLLSTVDGLDTPLEVDTKIANAVLGLATEAFVAAQLASRDASITALQASKADTALLASYATNAALSRAPSTQASRSSPPCSFPAAELLTRRPGRASQLGSSFAESQPALCGSLCCAGQRRRHAEHHGRLLLHGGH